MCHQIYYTRAPRETLLMEPTFPVIYRRFVSIYSPATHWIPHITLCQRVLSATILIMQLPDVQIMLILILLVIWMLSWKGVALWMAARRSHLTWFVILLVVNTLAILDIIYIFWIGRQYTIEANEQESSAKTTRNRQTDADTEK